VVRQVYKDFDEEAWSWSHGHTLRDFIDRVLREQNKIYQEVIRKVDYNDRLSTFATELRSQCPNFDTHFRWWIQDDKFFMGIRGTEDHELDLLLKKELKNPIEEFDVV
jgi:hypothetical protein